MLSTSFAFRRYVAEGRHLATRVQITFADGTSDTLYGEDLVMGGVSVSTATSSTSGFDIGAAIVGSADLTLANYDGRWDDADFTDATCVISVGADLDGGTEWVRKGVYGIEQPESYDSTIGLSLRDNMRLFQLDYSEVGTTYPATLRTIVTDICQECGVTMLSASFPRDSLVVQNRPDDANTSCLDVLSWAAQAACCFADVDTWGRLRVRWYDTAAFETEDWLDGGTYDTTTTPYSDGDTADGGAFHHGGDGVNGGSFTNSPWAVVTAIRSLTTTTDDVVVTGVEVTASDQVRTDGAQGADGETYLYGSAGYVLKVSGNPLIEYGMAQTVASSIGAAAVGMRFRPLTVSALGNPAVEAGDPMLVVDRKGRTYRSWVTGSTWKHGGFQSLSCDAETPARNKADAYSAQTRAIVEQRNRARAERTAREQAIANLANQLENASGLYKTEQEQSDHSVIYYLHDKPTLADSQIIWKLTSQAFGISTDGGATYPFGFDAWGNAILNAIYTIGINASYINTGSLLASLITSGKIQSQNGKVYFDLTNNELHCDKLVSTSSGTVGNFTAAIKSSTLLGYTIYGLALDNSNYADGTITISPGTKNEANIYYRPNIATKDGLYIIGGRNYGTARSIVEVTPSNGISLSVDGYYLASQQRGPRIDLNVPTSNSAPTYDMVFETTRDFQWAFDKSGAKFNWTGYGPTLNWLTVSGNKNRLVDTEDYGGRLMCCYETPAPMFGDIGSGVLGEDGTCVVEMDDIFSECARTDIAYQVFLQKCGPGDLWVSEKAPGYFVVEGTPTLAFDWEVKAHQLGYEAERLEELGNRDNAYIMGQEDLTPLKAYDQNEEGISLIDLYEDELAYIEQIESLYEEAA